LNLLEEGEESLTKASLYAKKHQNSLIGTLEDALSKNKQIQNAFQTVLKTSGI
jgi:hypothetical protein